MAAQETQMAKGMSVASKSEAEWRAEADLHTLIEAEKIKRDGKRLKAAMAKKREMEKTLKRVGD